MSRDQVHVSRLLSTEGLGHLATFPVAGVIEPRPTGTVWVIVENVYGGRRMESTVDATGAFQVGDIKGNNIFIVCAGSEVLIVAPIKVQHNEVLTFIRVNSKTGKVEPVMKRHD